MVFYKVSFRFHEILFDEEKRIHSAIRIFNEKYWGETDQTVYIVITEADKYMMTLLCVTSAVSIDSENITKQICQRITCIEEEACVRLKAQTSDSFTLNPITIQQFQSMMQTYNYDKLIVKSEWYLKKIGLNGNDFFEEIIWKQEDWDTAFDNECLSYIPKAEAKRILTARKQIVSTIPPVHYVIFEGNMGEAGKIIRELLLCLRAGRRIWNPRIVRITKQDVDSFQKTRPIQNLSCLNGGVVILEMNYDIPIEIAENLLRSVYFEQNEYNENYTVILMLSSGQRSIFNLAMEICAQWVFVEIQGRKISYDEAISYFRKMLADRQIVDKEEAWKDHFDSAKKYSCDEIEKVYQDWFRNIYCAQKCFPQYQKYRQRYLDEKGSIEGKNAREMLEHLTGLETVKELVDEILAFYKVQTFRKKIDGSVEIPTMHMVFYGNPGTAKTTVARLLGKIMKEEGLLEKGELYEVGRQDLVGRYVGWTAKNVSEYFKKAKGSVLFVDEAYSLADEKGSFGDEAINTLVQEMENHRRDTVVILAGYKSDMNRMLDRNPGLRSRIAFYVDFPDYSCDELYEILLKMTQAEKMRLEDGVREVFFEKLQKQDTSKGNGRLVRNIYDRAKLKQAKRIVDLSMSKQKQELFLLRKEDFA